MYEKGICLTYVLQEKVELLLRLFCSVYRSFWLVLCHTEILNSGIIVHNKQQSEMEWSSMETLPGIQLGVSSKNFFPVHTSGTLEQIL